MFSFLREIQLQNNFVFQTLNFFSFFKKPPAKKKPIFTPDSFRRLEASWRTAPRTTTRKKNNWKKLRPKLKPDTKIIVLADTRHEKNRYKNYRSFCWCCWHRDVTGLSNPAPLILQTHDVVVWSNDVGVGNGDTTLTMSDGPYRHLNWQENIQAQWSNSITGILRNRWL